MPRTYHIATRRSKMALVQTQQIIAALQQVSPSDEFLPLEITSDGCYEKFKGDLATIGGKGAFVRSLEVALLDGRAHMAMHSLKDMPGDEPLPNGLCLGAVMQRNDMRDAVVCRVGETFVGLRAGARVGTSSLRRAAQLRMAFPHLSVVPLRGNADTRVAKVDSGEVDAAILAHAGLMRIGLQHRVCEVFEPDIMVPAVGQGVVAVESITSDPHLTQLLAQITHADTMACITAERAMLMRLQGSCHTPIAGYCTLTANRNLRLIAMVANASGSTVLRARHKLPYQQAEALGHHVAEDLLTQGAGELLGHHVAP
jgi:hydroxymethylbilane synthase